MSCKGLSLLATKFINKPKFYTMNLLKTVSRCTLAMVASMAIVSCSSDDDDSTTIPEMVVVTQNDVDVVSTSWKSGITADEYGSAVSIPHGGSGLTSAETNRDVYSNQPLASAIVPGTIITKRTYKRNTDGSNGDLLATFAMVKREAGFWAEGGDWEYFKMPFNASTDYSAQPNGNLAGAEASGKLDGCKGCHTNAPGGNLLFVK